MKTVEWADGAVKMIDQTLLPGQEKFIYLKNYHEVAEAIKVMRVRGAPAIGVTAALGLALTAFTSTRSNTADLMDDLQETANVLGATRPTAVNLFWGITRMMRKAKASSSKSVEELKRALLGEAIAIQEEDIARNTQLGNYGADLIDDGDSILTHCNAGALACAGFGTAVGVITAAWQSGKKIHVYVDETRPLLQGARLTAWELTKSGIPMTLITDSMAGYFMRHGKIQKVVVGADRIAANGDTANKIGTYTVATLAKAHNIPFYVAAPTSTVDLDISEGDDIVIEERADAEITKIGGIQVAPTNVQVANPAFDITPNSLVKAIITETGVIHPPYRENLKAAVERSESRSPVA